MHIAINAQLLTFANSVRNGGISRYSLGLLKALSQTPNGHRYDAYVSADGQPCRSIVDSAVNVHDSGRLTVNAPGRILWEQAIFPLVLRRTRPDVVHNLAFASPMLDDHCTVITLHDLSFVHHPQMFNATNRLYLTTVCKLSAARAARIITVSKAMKADISRTLGIDASRIDVTYPGVDERFHPMPTQAVTEFRRARDLPATFILHLATMEPRKNLSGLLDAYALLDRPRPPLYVVGAQGWRSKSILDRVRAAQFDGDVRFLGFRPADELVGWYCAAAVFVFPSLYEGFGLPVVEAMACGTPVITSNRGSLQEVGDRAAELVAPTSARALANAMQSSWTIRGGATP